MASILAHALVVLFVCSFRFAVIFGWCNRYSSYCDSYQVCCRNQCVYGSNCLYQSCSMDSDCSVNEACCSDKCRAGSDCIGQSCSKESDCSVNEACCSGKCHAGYGCLGKACSKKSDCSVGESCCRNVCKYDYDCSGYLCSSSNDCSIGQDCCDGVCDYCVDQTAVIVGAVVGSLGALFLLLMFIYCCNRRARLGCPGRVVIGRPVTTTVAATTHTAIHAPPQVYQQGYQQGYPYQSLPQYAQYQNAAPPPYSGGMATGCVLPPPYNPETQEKEDGGCTSHPTCGAVQSA